MYICYLIFFHDKKYIAMMNSINKLICLNFFLFLQIIVLGQTAEFSSVTPVNGSKYLNPEQNIILKTNSNFENTSNSKLKASYFLFLFTSNLLVLI
jgi:hypothetical protein